MYFTFANSEASTADEPAAISARLRTLYADCAALSASLVSSEESLPSFPALTFARTQGRGTPRATFPVISLPVFAILSALLCFMEIGRPDNAALNFPRCAADSGSPVFAKHIFRRASADIFFPLHLALTFAPNPGGIFLPFMARLFAFFVRSEWQSIPAPPSAVFTRSTPRERISAIQNISRSLQSRIRHSSMIFSAGMSPESESSSTHRRFLVLDSLRPWRCPPLSLPSGSLAFPTYLIASVLGSTSAYMNVVFISKSAPSASSLSGIPESAEGAFGDYSTETNRRTESSDMRKLTPAGKIATGFIATPTNSLPAGYRWKHQNN